MGFSASRLIVFLCLHFPFSSILTLHSQHIELLLSHVVSPPTYLQPRVHRPWSFWKMPLGPWRSSFRWDEASISEGCKGWTLVDSKVYSPDPLPRPKAPRPPPIRSVACWLLWAGALFWVERSSPLVSIWNRSKEPNQLQAPGGSGWDHSCKSMTVQLLPLSNCSVCFPGITTCDKHYIMLTIFLSSLSQALQVQPLTHSLSSGTSFKILGLILNQPGNWALTLD